MFKNEQISKVYQDINPAIVRTPSLFSPHLSELSGAKVYLKLESMQKTGSFKERGALNFLMRRKEQSLTHVVAASAGNHAQAVALHAGHQKIRATIFMPKGTPNTKILQTKRLNAFVNIFGNGYDEAFNAAQAFAKEQDAHYLHAYDDLDVVCGQATVGLEINEQVEEPDFIFIPVGGGGLISGVGKYFANISGKSRPKIIGVEVKNYQSMSEALNQGGYVLDNVQTIAEGIAVKRVGGIARDICRTLDIEMTAVCDQEIQNAIMYLLERQKIVAEGAAASVVAALLSEKYQRVVANKKVVLVVSGGNIDVGLLSRLSGSELIKTNRLGKVSITLDDRPGSLARLLSVIDEGVGNIVDIHHERSFAKLQWNEVLVNLTIETQDESHEFEMLSNLRCKGYSINKYQLEL